MSEVLLLLLFCQRYLWPAAVHQEVQLPWWCDHQGAAQSCWSSGHLQLLLLCHVTLWVRTFSTLHVFMEVHFTSVESAKRRIHCHRWNTAPTHSGAISQVFLCGRADRQSSRSSEVHVLDSDRLFSVPFMGVVSVSSVDEFLHVLRFFCHSNETCPTVTFDPQRPAPVFMEPGLLWTRTTSGGFDSF